MCRSNCPLRGGKLQLIITFTFSISKKCLFSAREVPDLRQRSGTSFFGGEDTKFRFRKRNLSYCQKAEEAKGKE